MAGPTPSDESNGFPATHHDTEDRRLERAGIELRRRLENGQNVWELEVGGATRAAPGGPAGPPPALRRLLVATLRGRTLVPVQGEEPERPSEDEQAGSRKSASALEHLTAYLRRQLVEIERSDPGARLGDDPDAIHDLRVAARRSRAALRAAKTLVEPGWATWLAAELKWLGGELGPARDLDVLIGHLRPEAAELGEGGAAVIRRLEDKKTEAYARSAPALESPRYLRLLDELERGASRPPAGPAPDGALEKVARKHFRNLRREVKGIPQDPTDAALHRVRIRGKRARYAAELAEPAVGKPARKFLDAAKLFQDVVGEHQDAVVAEARLLALLPEADGREEAYAVGRLTERQRARKAAARAQLASSWKRLERRGRAWV